MFDVVARNADKTPVSGAALAAIRHSTQGCSGLFSNLIIRSGSTIIENFEYNTQLGIFLSTVSQDRKVWLGVTEGYDTDNNFAGGSRRRYHMQIYSSLFSQDIALPLNIFAGGIQLEWTIAPANAYFTAGVDNFTIESPFLCCDPGSFVQFGTQSSRDSEQQVSMVRT